MERGVRYLVTEIGEVIRQNVMLISIGAFFIYWTFYAGRMNFALLVLVIALITMIICRVVYYFSANGVARLAYRALVLLSAGLIFAALCIQTARFIFVFLPGLSEPTLPKILVRIGIATTILWAYAVPVAFVYYLYAHDMTQLIWNGSLDRLLRSTFLSNRRETARRVRHANVLLVRTLVWGGLLSVLTLLIGVIAWLLR